MPARVHRRFERLNDLLPRLRGAASARFSASVFPVTVIASPCRKPRSSRCFHHRRRAAHRVQILLDVFAARLQVGQQRHAIARALEVGQLQRHVAAFAIASRCRTALVEPPTAMIIVMAFSNDRRVRMSRGLRSRSSSGANGRAGTTALVGLAGILGRQRRTVWQREAQGLDRHRHRVRRVHPPHAPAPGQAWRTMSSRCSSVIVPARYSPYD